MRRECEEMVREEVSKINQDKKKKIAQIVDEVGKKNDLKLRDLSREIEELKKMKRDPSLEKQREMKREIEDLRKMKKEMNVDKFREMRADIEELKKTNGNLSHEKIKERSREIEELNRARGEENLMKGEIVWRNELEDVKKEIINRGVEEMKKGKKVEEKKIEVIEERVEEIERERRKKNIMIFNLKESEKGEAVDRYKEDEENLRQMMTEDMEIEDIQIEKLIRLGRKKDGNRPLLVKMVEEEAKRELIRRANKLRHSTRFPKVYMTDEERENDRRLRQELRERRSQHGGVKLIIRRGRVMERGSQEGRRVAEDQTVDVVKEVTGGQEKGEEGMGITTGEMASSIVKHQGARPKASQRKENF